MRYPFGSKMVIPETRNISIDRNARAYGWEVGRHGLLVPIMKASHNNPFKHVNWRDNMTVEGGKGMKVALAFVAGGAIALSGVLLGWTIAVANTVEV